MNASHEQEGKKAGGRDPGRADRAGRPHRGDGGRGSQPPAGGAEGPQEEPLRPGGQISRLAAEYDNYRRRSQKEKESAWSDAKADTAAAFLPVYDNLERALKQETADEAYKKGVEMTMTQLKEVLAKLGIEEIPALGEPFDPNLHNAVMHVEDEGAGENTIVDVFQTGFRSGDKVVRSPW